MSEDPEVVATGLIVDSGREMTLHQPCNAPAPLVVNGGVFVGCIRQHGHDGPHRVEISW